MGINFRNMKLKDTDIITVCADCLRACCWMGEFMCDENTFASTKDFTVKQLRRLATTNKKLIDNGEHEDYWEKQVNESLGA